MTTKEITIEDREELKRLINEYGIVAVGELMVEIAVEDSGGVKPETADEVRCAFCGKRRDQVDSLIAGPNVYICVECVGLCNEMIENMNKPTATV